MNTWIPALCCLVLTACASTTTTPFDAEEQLRLQQLIDRVATRQQVSGSVHSRTDTAREQDPHVLFSSDYSQSTTTLLAAPQLMPALLEVQGQSLLILVGVAAGPAQLQDLSHGMRLSQQLQQFLQDQQYRVQRRLDASAGRNQIQLKLVSNPES